MGDRNSENIIITAKTKWRRLVDMAYPSRDRFFVERKDNRHVCLQITAMQKEIQVAFVINMGFNRIGMRLWLNPRIKKALQDTPSSQGFSLLTD
jgi:hypothetical protein